MKKSASAKRSKLLLDLTWNLYYFKLFTINSVKVTLFLSKNNKRGKDATS